MLYAFVQFFREANGELATVSTVPTRKPGPGRLDARSGWIQLRSSERTLLSKDTQPNGVMVMGKFRSAVSAVMVMWSCAAYAQAQDAPPASQGNQEVSKRHVEELRRATALSDQEPGSVARPELPPDQQPADPQWQYGGFLDAAYLLDFNHPSNHLFRSRGTAYKVGEPILNIAGAYLRKTASEASRWGMEFTLQSGQDSRIFGFSAIAPNLGGSEWLRHLGPTDVSYLVRWERV